MSKTTRYWLDDLASVVDRCGYIDRSDGCVDVYIHGDDGWKALAAICLYDQPFGFTRYDVWLLRHAADHAKPAHPELHDLADRIAALLPPEAA